MIDFLGDPDVPLISAILERAEAADFETLRSQFIDEAAAHSLASGNYEDFLWERAALMMATARDMVTAGGGRQAEA